MTSATLKKADLIEMAQQLGLDFASTSRKDKIESVIRDHLLSHREDIPRDKRYQLFSIPPRGPVTKPSSGSVDSKVPVRSRRGSHHEDDAASPPDSETESLSDDTRLGAVKERVDAGVAHVKETLSMYHERTHEAVSTTYTAIQHQVSTVAMTNVALIAVEYVYLIYTGLPNSFFGTWHYGLTDAFDSVKHDVLYFTAILIALPLVITFIVNFTKMDSIRRKKHVYLVDPILFGIIRFYIATLLFVTNYAALRRYAILAGAAGISSALIGVYASLLQTS